MDEMKRIDRVLKYKGAIVDVYDDIMQSPSGNIAHWDYIAHRKGAAAVLPVTEDGKILRLNADLPEGFRWCASTAMHWIVRHWKFQLDPETAWRS